VFWEQRRRYPFEKFTMNYVILAVNDFTKSQSLKVAFITLSDSYRGINRPDIKTLCFVTLFSCGASGYIQTTLLGRCGYICNKAGRSGKATPVVACQMAVGGYLASSKSKQITGWSVAEIGLLIPR
jgi:hypothetical protein